MHVRKQGSFFLAKNEIKIDFWLADLACRKSGRKQVLALYICFDVFFQRCDVGGHLWQNQSIKAKKSSEAEFMNLNANSK